MIINKLSKLAFVTLFFTGVAVANPYGNTPYGQPMMGKGPGFGQGMGGPMGHKPMMGRGMMMGPGPFAGIEFNEQQKKKIDDLMAKERQLHQDRMKKMQETQQKLRKLYQAEKWDVVALHKRCHIYPGGENPLCEGIQLIID